MSLIIDNVTSIYGKGTPEEMVALDEVSITIERGDLVAIVGRTGSGKSTLAQHMNALLLPNAGSVTVDGVEAKKGSPDLRKIRRSVGLVFQYPEQSFFCSTVREEIAYAPQNYGVTEDELDKTIEIAARSAGLPNDVLSRDPFSLSGGMRRRAALAAVLSSEPNYLVLDEPLAGLDQAAHEHIVSTITELSEKGIGVVIVTHDLEFALRKCRRIAILVDGRLTEHKTPEDAARAIVDSEVPGLTAPPSVAMAAEMQKKGIDIKLTASVNEIVDALIKYKAR